MTTTDVRSPVEVPSRLLGQAVLCVMFAVSALWHHGPEARASAPAPETSGATRAACDVPSVSFAVLDQLYSQTWSDAPRTDPAALAGAATADAEVDRAIRRRLALFLACSCAGEPLRVFALYSERYLGELLSRERGFGRGLYEAWSEPRPTPLADCPTLRSASTARLLENGRVASLVTIYYPNIDRVKRFIFDFAKENAQWQIDDIDGEISFSLP